MTTLRDAIHDLHKVAETTRFTKLLLSGNITPELYSLFLQNIFPIYSLIEEYATSNGFLKDIPDIKRSDLIRKDIQELNCLPVEILKSTNLYLNHISNLAKEQPKLILAHLYVRHFGDMYGGQMIKKVVPGSGSMYEFNDKKMLIEKVRSMLTPDLANEANIAMQFTIDIFDEIANDHDIQ